MTNNDRRPAGTPAGGQFAPQPHAEADISLTDPAERPLTPGVARPELSEVQERLADLASRYYVDSVAAAIVGGAILLKSSERAIVAVLGSLDVDILIAAWSDDRGFHA